MIRCSSVEYILVIGEFILLQPVMQAKEQVVLLVIYKTSVSYADVVDLRH